MHVVAIAQLGTSIEAEADALAASLGTLAYEEKLKLRAGAPAIVLSTPDAGRAATLADEIRGRGHDVLVCDTTDVVASSAMTSLRVFRFDPEALVAAVALAELELLWNDIAALVLATHRTHTETVETVQKKQFSLSRAIATGGLLHSKKVKSEAVSRSDDSEPVLYLFPRSGQPPWLLTQHRADFGALGDRIAATAAPNFRLTVELLRERARFAAFDDRLVKRKGTIAEIDLLAHLVAQLG